MSNESTTWNTLPENSTGLPLETAGQQDGYVLLLVLLSVFLGGTLVLISVLLILYRHCCQGRRYARASDDPEKTNTTYLDKSQPTHEITIRVDESDCLSVASCHDQETDRFLSTCTQGRRVSFNEAALFDHSKKTQEKGRRYTLTEGDFHHLKNARLTHLHIPPPALKIVTIHECDSAENTIVAMATRPAAKSALSIFQPVLCPLPQTALTSMSISPSSALPGDTLNSVVDTSFNNSPLAHSIKEPGTSSIEVTGARSRNGGSPGAGNPGEGLGAAAGGVGSQGPMLQFFTKLRRHASLEGASPYFKIKKWKLDSSQRASSLDTRGSPKRRQFQRQRAASESMDQEDNDAHHIDLIQYIARTQDITYCPSRPLSTPPPSLGRLEVEVMVEPSCSRGGPGVIGLSPDPQDEALTLGCEVQEPRDPQAVYRDIWTLRASLEQYVSSDRSSNNDRDSVRSDADSVCSLGGPPSAERGSLPSYPSQDIGDEGEGEGELDEGLGKKERKQDSVDSERGGSDSESGTRKLLQMDSGYTSIEVPLSRAPEDMRLFGSGGGSPGADRTALERRHHFTSAGRTSTVGDSFETHLSEEGFEEESEPGASGGVAAETGAGALGWAPYGQLFTPREAMLLPPPAPPLHRRDYSIDEKTDALFHEFLRHDPQFDQQESPLRKHRSRVHLRKQWQRHKQYSDPGVRYFHSSFERQRTPLRRGDSVNYPLDTGYHSTLPRIVSAPDEEASDGATSTPDTPKAEADAARAGKVAVLQRKESSGSSVGCSFIRDEDTLTSRSPPAPSTPTSPASAPILGKEGSLGEMPEFQEDSRPSGPPPEPPDEHLPPRPPDTSGYGPQTITAELTDKLTASLDERLYAGLRRTKDAAECVSVTVTHASPDHSPV
ncbi:voltage-dependent calcium channel beta subunit-associated regulatory protein [Aplochiton taeniatus]